MRETKKYFPDNVDLIRMKNIGNLLKEYRKGYLMSRDELAKEYSISRSLIERAERGENITLLSYFRLCKIMMADPVEIMNSLND